MEDREDEHAAGGRLFVVTAIPGGESAAGCCKKYWSAHGSISGFLFGLHKCGDMKTKRPNPAFSASRTQNLTEQQEYHLSEGGGIFSSCESTPRVATQKPASLLVIVSGFRKGNRGEVDSDFYVIEHSQ